MPQNDIVLVVMGSSGAGKSTFIHHAGRKAKSITIGHGLSSCTSTIQPIKIKTGPHNVILIDTPGDDKSGVSDADVLRMIADWLLETYKNQVKLAGILYMHRISDNRTTGDQLNRLKKIAKLCGSERVVLATTMWSLTKQDAGDRREAELKLKTWKDMIDRGAQVARFEDTSKSAWEIIGKAYEPLARETEVLQKELADLHSKLCKTQMGETLYRTLENQLDEEKRLKELYDKAESQGNSASVRDLEVRYQDVQQKLEETFKEIQAFNPSLGKRFLRSLKSVFHY